MPNLNSTEYAAQLAAAYNGAAMADGNKTSQSVNFARVRYTLTAAEASADVLRILQLGPGCTLIPALCSVYCSDPGTVLTGTIGLSTDVDAYSSLLTLDAGGLFRFVPTTYPTELTEPAIVQMVLGTVTAPTLGAVIEFDLAWTTRH